VWYSACDNPQALTRLFTSVGDVSDVEMHEAVLHRDGPRLQLRFDISSFPDRPSPRWHPSYNTLQVQVSFWGLDDLRIEGWPTRITGRLSLDPAGEGLHVAFDAPGCSIAARCRLARIEHLSPYLSETPEA
jgi:hypothetical protein